MYSSKENVNILTALLVKHGIRHAVVCPGSRNAPIVHNLNECPDIQCHPVTDERSAGFYALGMTLALAEPVVVCVTSGTALLNLQPAVAEAWYQHQPLVVVSADRPGQWIDQLDGQTLPQPDALGRFVRKAVSLPEVSRLEESKGNEKPNEERWYCNRLINEALLEATAEDARPVHINVPITEPLFTFDVSDLPDERHIIRTRPFADYDGLCPELVEGLSAAKRPMIVFGQTNPHDFEGGGVGFLFSHVIVLHESLSTFPSISHFDEVLYRHALSSSDDDDQLLPDFILYVGGTIVSKRLRHFLRQASHAVTWRISKGGELEDAFMNLRGIVEGDPEYMLQSLDQKMSYRKMNGTAYRRRWLNELTQASRHASAHEPTFSQMATVKCFESQLAQSGIECQVHYANSTAIRLANIYASHHVWCNRGVNGIEGSLSTAAGFSVMSSCRVFCVIGDLSFFYDGNALWNKHLHGNLRILLLNNGRGGIFGMLRGLKQSPACDELVAASHHTTAEGICQQNDIHYKSVFRREELPTNMAWLITTEDTRPFLLEVFTDANEDEQAFKKYYQQFLQAERG